MLWYKATTLSRCVDTARGVEGNHCVGDDVGCAKGSDGIDLFERVVAMVKRG